MVRTGVIDSAEEKKLPFALKKGTIHLRFQYDSRECPGFQFSMIGDGDGNGCHSRIKHYPLPHLYMAALLLDFKKIHVVKRHGRLNSRTDV